MTEVIPDRALMHFEAMERGDYNEAIRLAEQLALEAGDYDVEMYWWSRVRVARYYAQEDRREKVM